MSQRTEHVDILIVGAGPAGSVAAALLRQQGRNVLVLEKQQFPRFSIGESLLPQSMEYIEKAGMLRSVIEGGFQHKNGAAFTWGEKRSEFDFRDKFSPGWGTTCQVWRADFDTILSGEAARMGADVRFQHEVLSVDVSGERPQVTVRGADGEEYTVSAGFLLDASGFARILPRMLDLERPSGFPVRGAIYTQVRDHIVSDKTGFDRNKILISVHPQHNDVWYWIIPFSNGYCSTGVVAEQTFLARYEGDEKQRLQAIMSEDPNMATALKDAEWDRQVRQIVGYSANVSSLWGKNYALLGNAGEFLDPVFSSGVTIAFKSADLAASCLARQYAGETVDWQAEYAAPLKRGVDAFRRFVDSWYAGGFQKIIFHQDQNPDIRRMICAILAGYAWDTNNPYVAEPRRLSTLEQLCA